MGLAMAYFLHLAFRAGRLAQQWRGQVEVVRRRARHGSRRTLSLLSLALMLVVGPLLLSLSNLTRILKEPLQALRSGQTVMKIVAV